MNNRIYDERYKQFRQAVLDRDKHCQFPGCKKRVRLQVHHIIRWADSGEFRYNPTNGIALCTKHHKLVSGKEHLYMQLFFDIVRAKYGK